MMRNFIQIVEGAGLLTAYHGTFGELQLPFRPLTHFGTLKAATDRMATVARDAASAVRMLKSPARIPAWRLPSIERDATRHGAPPRIYAVSLHMNNPARIRDAAVKHSPTQIAFGLRDSKLITQEEMLTVTTLVDSEQEQIRTLVALLHSKGFDGVVYRNRYEDTGSDSYIILDPSQVVSVAAITPPA